MADWSKIQGGFNGATGSQGISNSVRDILGQKNPAENETEEERQKRIKKAALEKMNNPANR